MLVRVETRSGKEMCQLDLPDDGTVDDLKVAFARRFKQYYVDRQRFTVKEVKPVTLPNGKKAKPDVLVNGKRLIDYSLNTNAVIFKDLGPQVGWISVFLAEYAGPLVIYYLMYLRPVLFYGANAHRIPVQPMQTIAMWCWCGHYLKRILETIFVHRFSHNTMPVFNLFKNCGYYWGFALLVAYFVNHPNYQAVAPVFANLGLMLFLLSELCNFIVHVQLRNLRPPGSRHRAIPYGVLFNWVSCPNYTAEICAWIGFGVLTGSWAVYLFMLAGAGQMIIWAQGKHANYRRQFEDYPRNRTAIIPFLL